jgi:hypothetical protein
MADKSSEFEMTEKKRGGGQKRLMPINVLATKPLQTNKGFGIIILRFNETAKYLIGIYEGSTKSVFAITYSRQKLQR